MKLPAATFAAFAAAAPVEAQPRPGQPPAPRMAPAIVHDTVPALDAYTDEVLFADVWKRPELAPRDRSLVTIAALVAGGNTAQMVGHIDRALDNGVQPTEITGIITHLAFYSGWPRAMSAVPVARDVFEKRGIPAAHLAAVSKERLPQDQASETARAATVREHVAPTAPALARYTDEVLFADLWRRPDLTPRDRSLVTVAALIAGGQPEQMPFHMNRGMDNGLTQVQLSEAITHLAFYAGWPRAMSAVPVAKKVFDARAAEPAKQTTTGRQTVQIITQGSVPTTAGPAEYFSGAVKVDSRFQQNAPARIGGGLITFEPGARTAWHTHPVGQTLFVTSGCGLVQAEGGQARQIKPGDIVWIPPGEKHWHGATPNFAMVHLAVSEQEGGKSVDWMEKVTDDIYLQAGKQAGC